MGSRYRDEHLAVEMRAQFRHLEVLRYRILRIIAANQHQSRKKTFASVESDPIGQPQFELVGEQCSVPVWNRRLYKALQLEL